MIAPLTVLQVHGTTVALDGTGVLIRGPSGSGKSDLALRLIEQGWRLVADDRTRIDVEGGRLMASAPPALHGLLEVRGVGILSFPSLHRAPLGLVVDLVGRDAEPRLPDLSLTEDLPLAIRRVALWPFAASSPLKIRLALGDACAGGANRVVGAG
jgi:HPr kinase/phosphorylase